jgi:hypothetical protein
MPVDALLAQECQLEPVGGGAYERECSRVWWGFQAQHGGYVLGLAMTAVDMELEGSDMAIQHATMQYLRPFLDGPFRAEVQVERRGRTMANATVRMWSQGKLAGLALLSMATRREVAEFAAGEPPDVAPYDPDEAPFDPGFGLPVFDRVWLRPRIRETEGPGPARVGGWITPRTPEIVDHRWLAFLADLWPPVAYHVWPESVVAQSVDLTYHARTRLPRADLPPGAPLLVVLTSKGSHGGFVDEDAEIWTESGELIGISRQMRYVHAGR